jgi:hypothetical protein
LEAEDDAGVKVTDTALCAVSPAVARVGLGLVALLPLNLQARSGVSGERRCWLFQPGFGTRQSAATPEVRFMVTGHGREAEGTFHEELFVLPLRGAVGPCRNLALIRLG